MRFKSHEADPGFLSPLLASTHRNADVLDITETREEDMEVRDADPCLCVCLSVCLSDVCLSVCPSLYLSLCLSLCVSALPGCLSACLQYEWLFSVCLCVCLHDGCPCGVSSGLGKSRVRLHIRGVSARLLRPTNPQVDLACTVAPALSHAPLSDFSRNPLSA